MKQTKKILAFLLALALILTSLPIVQFEAEAASLTENGVKVDTKDPVKKSDGTRPTVMKQSSRVDNASKAKPNHEVGLCNVACTVTLLNRKAALDGAGVEFSGKSLIQAIGCTGVVYKSNAIYYKKGKERTGDIYSYDKKTGTGKCTSATYTMGNMTYKFTNKKCSYTSNEDAYSAIAKMIDAHPEGVLFYINSSKGCHWVVAYRYEVKAGKTQLYVYDPVNQASYTGGFVKWESSWLYKRSEYIRNKAKVYADLTNIAYISSTKTTNPTKKPTITKSSEQFPTSGQTLTQGKTFSLRGVYNVDSGTITNVTSTIKNQKGENVYSFKATPNTSSFNVNGTKGTSNKTLNSYMAFGKLPAGNYTIAMTITAKNTKGTTSYELSRTFKVAGKQSATTVKKPVFTKSNEQFPKNGQSLTQGKSFGLRGVYSVDSGTITNVTATIKTSTGATKYSYTATPNAKKYDVNGTKGTSNKTLNSYMGFGKLTAGKYTIAMTIIAKNGAETSTYQLSNKFTVGCSPLALQKASVNVGKRVIIIAWGDNVTYTSSNTSVCTVSTTGVVTGKKAGKATITVTINKAYSYKAEITVTESVKAPTISKSNEKFPTNGQKLTKGKSFALRGIYSVNSGTITKVTATIKNAAGKNEYTYTATPNAKTYDVNGTKGANSKTLNSYMTFGKLAAGKHTIAMTITATNAAGTTTYNLSRTFTVG